MVNIAITVAIIMQVVSLVLFAWRVLRGPTVADRVVATDAAAAVLVGLIVTGSMWLRETKYLDYALTLAILSFVSTIGFARYLERGTLIGRDSD